MDERADEIGKAVDAHLVQWGLRRFTTVHEYLAWQERWAPAQKLERFAEQVARRREGASADDVVCYDLAAQPDLLPFLHSQRYDYYRTVGPAVVSRIGDASSVLDFGCGAGILTTFYARVFPDRYFVGIDRSEASIAAARQKAEELGVNNIRFECLDVGVDRNGPSDAYDLILSTHALVQHERDPGLPSASWRTFERARAAGQQATFERRTGMGARLDRLASILTRQGRMIALEKTRQLARRVPFQRAMAARGLHLIEKAEPIRYRIFEDATDDGPLYHVGKGIEPSLEWDESPEPDDGLPFDPVCVNRSSRDLDAPLYENHRPSAQAAWERLIDRIVTKEATCREPDGRELHVELGVANGLAYLYCANTFDQRQLVVFDPAHVHALELYYREIVEGMPSPTLSGNSPRAGREEQG
ncbi:MAG: methyltransferase domain-containing protein [Nitrospira sp.]|nr:methyltransferase domain-containing protein [Nitrospira sp.]